MPILLSISAFTGFNSSSEISIFLLSVVWEAHLAEAETTFAIFQIHLVGVEVVQRPAESWQCGLLEGLHLEHLANSLQRAGGDKHTVTVVSVVPVLIRFAFLDGTLTRREHQVCWWITLLVPRLNSDSRLRNRQKSQKVFPDVAVNLFYTVTMVSIYFVFLVLDKVYEKWPDRETCSEMFLIQAHGD